MMIDNLKYFQFSKQVSTELYRKWYIREKREPKKYFDKTQILDLQLAILDQTSSLIEKYCNPGLLLLKDEFPVNFESPIFRCEFPILYINFNKFRKVIIKLFIIKNVIQCLNIPGCIVEGEDIKDAFNNLIIAVIQCIDIRFKYGMVLTEMAYPDRTFWNFDPIASQDYIKELKNDGWSEEFICPFHTVLINEFNSVTYTIPHNKTISSALRFDFKRLQFLTDRNRFNEMCR